MSSPSDLETAALAREWFAAGHAAECALGRALHAACERERADYEAELTAAAGTPDRDRAVRVLGSALAEQIWKRHRARIELVCERAAEERSALGAALDALAPLAQIRDGSQMLLYASYRVADFHAAPDPNATARCRALMDALELELQGVRCRVQHQDAAWQVCAALATELDLAILRRRAPELSQGDRIRFCLQHGISPRLFWPSLPELAESP